MLRRVARPPTGDALAQLGRALEHQHRVAAVRSTPIRRARVRAACPGRSTRRDTRSSSSSPRTRVSASATLRRDSSSSAVTNAGAFEDAQVGLAQRRRSGAAPGRAERVAGRADRGWPTARRAGSCGRARGPRRPRRRPGVVGADVADRGQPPPVDVQQWPVRRRAPRPRGREVGHVAAAQHQPGHPVVRVGRPLDRLAVRPDRSCSRCSSSASAVRVSSSSRALSMATAACAASERAATHRRGRTGGRCGWPRTAHRSTRAASRIGTPRMATRPSSTTAVVDRAGVLEAGVVAVVAVTYGRGGLRDQAAEPGAQRQPHCWNRADTEPSVTRM